MDRLEIQFLQFRLQSSRDYIFDLFKTFFCNLVFLVENKEFSFDSYIRHTDLLSVKLVYNAIEELFKILGQRYIFLRF